MKTHTDELISAQRDDPLGPAEELFLRHHVAECQECRAFAREVESADRLLRAREPYIAVPPLRVPRADGVGQRPAFAAVAVVSLVLGIVIGTTLGDLRTADPRAGSAGPVPLGASLSGAGIPGRGSATPWKVTLGESSAAVLASLGEPERRVDQDRQWVYRNVVVFFDAPASFGGTVWRITALWGSFAGTDERFWLGLEQGFERFHEIYAGHEVIETYPAGDPPPTTPGNIRPFVILSATGRDQAGNETTVSASFPSSAEPELLQIFRGHSLDGRAPAVAGPLDPVAVNPCELVIRAAVIAGYASPGYVRTPGPPRSGPHCNYVPYSTGIPSADLDLLWRPVGQDEIQDFLLALHPRTATSRAELGFTWAASAAAVYSDWQPIGPGQWLITPVESAGDQWSAYALVYVEPYLVLINDNGTERDEETVKRFAAAVHQVLLDVR